MFQVLKKIGNKKYLIGFAVLSLFSLIYILSSSRPSPSIPSPQTSHPPSAPTDTSPQPGTASPAAVTSAKQFFLRKLSFSQPVTSLYWSTPAPLALSKNEVYNLFTQDRLHKFPTNSTPISSSQVVAVQSEGLIFTYNPHTKQSESLTNSPSLYYSPSFKKSATSSDKQLTVSQENLPPVSFQLPQAIQKLVWSPDENRIAATSGNTLYLLSISQKNTITLKLPETAKRLLFSPSGEYLAVAFTENIYLYNLSKIESPQTVNFDPQTSAATFTWSPQNKIFLIEKRTSPREVDHVYLASPDRTSKIFVHDSFPISTRMNLEIDPVALTEEVLLFADGQDQVWILSTQAPHPILLSPQGDHHAEENE